MVPETPGIRSPDGDGDDGTVDEGRCGRLGETSAWARPPKPGRSQAECESACSDRRVTAEQKDGSGGVPASPELVDLDTVFGHVP